MTSPSLNYNEETPLTQRINNLTQTPPETTQEPTVQQTNTYEATVRRAAEDVITYLNEIVDNIFSSQADTALYQSIHPPKGMIHPEKAMSSTQQPYIQTTGVIEAHHGADSQAVYDLINTYLDNQSKDWSTSPAHTTDNQWFRRQEGQANHEQRIVLNETINADDYQYKPWSRTR
jgi:hypothetical protein